MDMISVLRQAGFEGEALRQAWAIMMRESGGNPQAFNGNRGTGDESYGLFQINMLGSLGPARLKQYGLKNKKELLDPRVNARVAYEMSKGGSDFGAWAIGPNAYKGAPSNAVSKYKEWYAKWPGAGRSGRGVPSRTTSSYAEAPADSPDDVLSSQRQMLMQYALSKGGISEAAGLLQNFPRQQAPEAPSEHPLYGSESPSNAKEGMLVPPTSWSGTHVTDGLDWNNGKKTAEDIMAKPGTPVGAPEDGVIVRHGSAQGGQALYFQGASGRMYWLGHIDDLAPVGTKVRQGQQIAVISADHAHPHLHIDVKQ